MTLNPYQAPSLAAEAARVPELALRGELYVDGDDVVAPRLGAQFPDRCVVCNQPAAGYRLEQRLGWHPRWVYVLILSPFIYVIVSLLTRRRARLSIGLCPLHRQRRTLGRVVGVCLIALGSASCAVASGARSAELALPLSMALMLLGVLVGALMSRTVTTRHIDAEDVRIRTGRAFLDSLR